MSHPISRFFALDGHSKLLFLKIVCLLAWYRAAILTTSLKTLASSLDHHHDEPSPARASDAQLEQAAHLGYLVAAAAAYTPWNSTCLVQVLTLQRLLAKEGIGGRFYLGVCRESDSGELKAHAWLRCGERIVNGAGGHEQFAVVSTYSWLES